MPEPSMFVDWRDAGILSRLRFLGDSYRVRNPLRDSNSLSSIPKNLFGTLQNPKKLSTVSNNRQKILKLS